MKPTVNRVKSGLDLTTNWYPLISQQTAECNLDLGEINTKNAAGHQRAIFQSSHMQLLCDLSSGSQKSASACKSKWLQYNYNWSSHSSVYDDSIGQKVFFIPEVCLFDRGDSFGEFSSWRNALFKIHNFSGNSTQVLWIGGENISMCWEYMWRGFMPKIARGKIAIIGYETGY